MRFVLAIGLMLSLVFAAPSAQAIDPMPFADRAEEVRFQKLLRELRCMQCQNQTLADSDADIARQLRNEVFRLMREGNSDQAIKDFLATRYGEFVLYNPPVKTSTWLLWFGPGLILLLGGLGVARHLRHRGRPAAPAASADDW